MKVEFRQGIVRYQKNAVTSAQTFLFISGGKVTLNAANEPTIITFANRNKNYLLAETVTVPNAWAGPFNGGTDYWLYWDIDQVTGVKSYGWSEDSPAFGLTPPPAVTPFPNETWNDGQHWFDTNTNQFIMRVWSASSNVWITKIRVFAALLQNGTTFVSLSDNTPLFSGTQIGVNLEIPIDMGYLMYDVFGNPIKSGTAGFFTTADKFTASVSSGTSLKIENSIIPATAQTTIAAYQVVQFNDYSSIITAGKIFLTSPPFGIIEENVIFDNVVDVVTAGTITSELWDFEADGAPVNTFVYNDSGVVRPANQYTPDPEELPIGVIIGKNTIVLGNSRYLISGGIPVPDDYVSSGDFNQASGILSLTRFLGGVVDIPGFVTNPHSHVEADIIDLDKYTQAQVDGLLGGKADIIHLHTVSDITDITTFYYDKTETDSLLAGKANAVHGHTASEITNATYSSPISGVSGITNTNLQSTLQEITDTKANLTPFYATESAFPPSASYTGMFAYADDSERPFVAVGGGIWVQLMTVDDAISLDDLTNTFILSPQDGEVLTYDDGDWINAPAGGGGLEAVEDDPNPVLGGDLDTAQNSIFDTNGTVFFESSVRIRSTPATAGVPILLTLFESHFNGTPQFSIVEIDNGSFTLRLSTDSMSFGNAEFVTNGLRIASFGGGDTGSHLPGSTNRRIFYPENDGTVGQVMTTDGTGNLSFEDGPSGLPAATDQQILVNDGTDWLPEDGDVWTETNIDIGVLRNVQITSNGDGIGVPIDTWTNFTWDNYVQDYNVRVATLKDVITTLPVNDEVLTYEAGTATWVNKVIPNTVGTVNAINSQNAGWGLVSNDVGNYIRMTSPGSTLTITAGGIFAPGDFAWIVAIVAGAAITVAAPGSVTLNGIVAGTFTFAGTAYERKLLMCIATDVYEIT